MTRDDVMRETLKHVRRVGNLMLDAVSLLQRRAMEHDDSKFSPEEFETFAEITPRLKSVTYGSEAYKAALREFKPAIQLHQQRNKHHPEAHESIYDMDLLELLEMLADWKAAGERHADGSLAKSILHNAERFGYDERFARLLTNTARNLGWVK